MHISNFEFKSKLGNAIWPKDGMSERHGLEDKFPPSRSLCMRKHDLHHEWTLHSRTAQSNGYAFTTPKKDRKANLATGARST